MQTCARMSEVNSPGSPSTVSSTPQSRGYQVGQLMKIQVQIVIYKSKTVTPNRGNVFLTSKVGGRKPKE